MWMHHVTIKSVPIVARVTRVLLGMVHTVKIKMNVLRIHQHFVMLIPSVTIRTPHISVFVMLASKATVLVARTSMNVWLVFMVVMVTVFVLTTMDLLNVVVKQDSSGMVWNVSILTNVTQTFRLVTPTHFVWTPMVHTTVLVWMVTMVMAGIARVTNTFNVINLVHIRITRTDTQTHSHLIKH